MSLSTPSNVRKLQRSLYVKAKSEPNFRFYSLFDKVFRADIMKEAWGRVKRNKGSSGVSSETYESIEMAGLDEWLGKLGQELKAGTYRPEPLLRVWIPKANGNKRPLSIPTIRDRVAQMCWYLVCNPIFEADLLPQQYGFRPKIDAKMAVRRIFWTLTKSNQTEVVDADLKDYFNTIPHSALMKSVSRRISDGRILSLLKLWLVAPVVELDKRGRKHQTTEAKDTHRGSGQGSVVSPLLANIYFRRFILAWQQNNLFHKHKSSIVSYADDFVICCKKGHGIAAMADMKTIITKLGLIVNKEKTSIVQLPVEPLDFLGYRFKRQYGKKGRSFLGTSPSPKAVRSLLGKIHEQTAVRFSCTSIESRVRTINPIIRGWSNYFNQGPVLKSYQVITKYTERRIRRFLVRKHKLVGTGYKTYPESYLYDQLGLFKLPKTMAEVASAKA